MAISDPVGGEHVLALAHHERALLWWQQGRDLQLVRDSFAAAAPLWNVNPGAAGLGFVRWALDHFQTSLRTGIAVHAGRAVVGRFGYFRARHLNAVGDVLNLAARLEDLNKDLDTDILVTEPVAEAARDLAQLGRSFAMKVRGRATPVTAYEVLGGRSATIAPEVRER